MITMEKAYCPHCGKEVSRSPVPGYMYQCTDCCEDFYGFECPKDPAPATDFDTILNELPDRMKCANLRFVCYGATSDPYVYYSCYDVPDQVYELVVNTEAHVISLTRWDDPSDDWELLGDAEWGSAPIRDGITRCLMDLAQILEDHLSKIEQRS